jgi:hypothetical protein
LAAFRSIAFISVPLGVAASYADCARPCEIHLSRASTEYNDHKKTLCFEFPFQPSHVGRSFRSDLLSMCIGPVLGNHGSIQRLA